MCYFYAARIPNIVFFITGCTSGFGLETVRVLTQRGATVVMACCDVPMISTVASEPYRSNIFM